MALPLAACGGPTATPSSPGSSLPASAGTSVIPSSPGTAATPASQAPSASVGAAYDACGLLPVDELDKIVGPGSQGNVMPGGGWMAAQCAWNTAGSSFLLSVGTADSIESAEDPAAPTAEALLATYQQAAIAAGKATDLAGVGDGAVQSTSGLAFISDGNYVQLLVVGPALEDDQLVQIAKLAEAGL